MKRIKVFEEFNLFEEFIHKPYMKIPDEEMEKLKAYLDEKGFDYFTPEEVNGIYHLKYATFLSYNMPLEVFRLSAEDITAKGGENVKYKPDQYRDWTYRYQGDILLVVVGKNDYDSYKVLGEYLVDHPIKAVKK